MTEPFQSIAVPVDSLVSRPQALPSPAHAAILENQQTRRSFESADFRRIINQDWILPNLSRGVSDALERPDPNFQMPLPDSPEGKDFWSGIDPADYDRFLNSHNAEHFQRLKQRYFKQRETERLLAETGLVGSVIRFGTNILDPVGVAASLGAGPVGWISKGSRLAAFTRAGILAAGTNAALETAALSGSMVRDSSDVVLSGLFGFALGGSAGLLIRRSQHAKLNASLASLERRVIAEDLAEEAAKRGKTMTVDEAEKLVDAVRRPPKVSPKAKPEPEPTAPFKSIAEPAAAAKSVRTVATRVTRETAVKVREWTTRILGENKIGRLLRKTKLSAEEATQLRTVLQETLDADALRVAAGLNDTMPPAVVRRFERLSKSLDDDLSKDRVLGDEPSPVFNPDTLGDSAGARRAHVPQPVLDTEWLEELAKPVGMTAKELSDFVGFGGFGIRYDYASVLRGIKDPDLRGTLGLLVGDPVGPVRGAKVNPIGATEEAARLSKITRTQFLKAAQDQYSKWLQAQGIKDPRALLSPSLRDKFMTEVGHIMSGIPGNYSAEARALASTSSKLLNDIGDELVRLEILDEKLDNYFPRRLNYEAIEDANIRFHTEALEELFYQSARRGQWGQAVLRDFTPEFAEKLIRKASLGYLKRIREIGRNIDVEVMHGVSGRDVEYLTELLRDGGADDAFIADVVGKFKERMAARGKDDAGKPSFAKHRFQLDETTSIQAWDHVDPNRGFKELRLVDLLEKNAEIVLHRYFDMANGRIALAKVVGIRKDADFKRMLNAAKSRIDDEATRNKYVKYAQDAFDHLVGRPLEADPDGRTARVARTIRNFNLARVGSSFGLAQLGDLGNVVSEGGMKGLLIAMKDFRQLTQKGADGLGDKGLVRELRQFAALGLDYSSTSIFASDYGDIFTSRAGKIDFAVRGASRFVTVASGMTKLTEWQQVAVGRMIVNKFARGKMTQARLNYVGLSADDAAEIQAKLKAHGTIDENGNVSSMGLDAWGDDLLRDKWVNAIRKAATRAVQENEFGATFPFMHRTLGKIVTQFRNFMLVAWTKQTLHNLNMRDWEAFSNLMWSLCFGGLSYTAYVAAMKPADQWEEALAPEKLASAAFARAGMSSLIPALIDTPLTMLGNDPLFAYRSSGLPSNAFSGIPTVELADRLQKTVSAVYQGAVGDRPFSEKDLNNAVRMSVLSNFWGVPHLTHAAAQEFGLPEDSR